jgi:transitional endoplasmic reticulum ATPase
LAAVDSSVAKRVVTPQESVKVALAKIADGTETAPTGSMLERLANEVKAEVERREVVVRDAKIGTSDQVCKPDKMSYREAIEILQRKQKDEETEIAVREDIDAFAPDAAHALGLAITELYGVGFGVTIPPSMFSGPKPPMRLSIPVSRSEHVTVPWGRMELPGITGYIETQIAVIEVNNREKVMMVLTAKTLKKHEAAIQRLAQRTRELVVTRSIYRGKAVKIDFDNDNSPLGVMPEFLADTTEESAALVMSASTEKSFRGSVLTPIQNTRVCRDMGIPLRRGILLHGPFGTGKTLSAALVATECERHGWTFIYLKEANQLPEARELARRYTPAVIFAEDLDSIIEEQDPQHGKVERCRNALDSVDGKGDEVIVLCTTNRLEYLREKGNGLLRPGRFDALIEIGYPDPAAAERLVRMYGRGLISPLESLELLRDRLAGNSAAMIREVVERAKLWAVAHGATSLDATIGQIELLDAADELRAHMEIMAPPAKPTETRSEVVVRILTEGLRELVRETGVAALKDSDATAPLANAIKDKFD